MYKLELKSSHEVIYTVDVADVESIFFCKPTDPDILTVLMKDGKRLYCDEVCPINSLQEEHVSEVWHDANEEQPEEYRTVVTWNPIIMDGEVLTRCAEVYKGRVWAYIEDLLNLSNVEKTVKDRKEPVSDDLELGWEDIEQIYFLVMVEANKLNKYKHDVKEMYQEVLKRFVEMKEK